MYDNKHGIRTFSRDRKEDSHTSIIRGIDTVTDYSITHINNQLSPILLNNNRLFIPNSSSVIINV